jgi:hypothetical protein
LSLATTFSVFSSTPFSNLLGLLYLKWQVHVLTAISNSAFCLVFDGFHDLVPLSSLDVEDVGSSVSLSTSTSSVQATWNLLGILIMKDHMVMTSADLAYSSVLLAYPAGFFTICSTTTSFL